eukprot:g14880.t1 g14880   contig21:66535-67089(+)
MAELFRRKSPPNAFTIQTTPTNQFNQSTMKSFAIALLALVATTSAATPSRKRAAPIHKSSQRVLAEEEYDPYMGMQDRKLASMSMSMHHEDDGHDHDHDDHDDHDGHDHSMSMGESATNDEVADDSTAASGAMTVGTAVAAIATGAVIMFV